MDDDQQTDTVTTAARTARAAQPPWAALPLDTRTSILLRWHDHVLDSAEDLLASIQRETGKSRASAFEEVADTANTLRYYGYASARVLAPTRRRGVIPLLTRVVELRHPHGLIGVISPWNYPLTLAAADIIPALAAGNAVLHKPDPATMGTARLVRSLAIDAGLPADLWQLVDGDPATVGGALIDSVDHLVFTGSTATGRIVAARAGSNLIAADLELGGKNAMIVCEDAPLGAAVAGAIRGSFSSAGQLCLSFERIYVHSSILDTFVKRFTTATRNHEPVALMGPDQLNKTVAHISDAVSHGAIVIAGGRARPDLGAHHHEPTILTDVTPAADAYTDETFGPVVAVYPFDTDDEAIALANASDYGLNASVWSRSRRRAAHIAARLEAGTVNINEAYAAAWGSVDAPMGGVKDSGIGRRHGADSLRSMTWPQTIATQRLLPIGERGLLRGKRYERVMTMALRLMKKLRRR